MYAEKRKYPRYSTKDLNAVITISPPPPDEHISLKGTVLDMSHQGIKIKLDEAMPNDIPTSKIVINIVLPLSKLPVKIKGVIRHLNEKAECGINYQHDHTDVELENLLFECIKVH